MLNFGELNLPVCDLATMAATRVQRRCAVEKRNPLSEADILQNMLGYVGPGHWFFLSTVSSLWQRLYSRVACSRKQKYRYDPAFPSAEEFTCVPQLTLYSSIFASPSRVALKART
jgi:hypothetical protein